MRGSRFTDEPIIGFVREADAGASTAELCRRHGISPATFYNRKARFGGMGVNEARRLRQLEAENGKIKQLLAESALDNHALRDLLRKMADACGAT
jgi:putative transposase